MSDVEDQPQLRTVRAVLVSAGISPDRAVWHFAQGRVRVDGEPVDDLDREIGEAAKVTLWTT